MDSDLEAVLRGYPAIARPSDEPEPLGNAGGLSGSRLWRYRSGLGTLLARAWPTDGPKPTTLLELHGWLQEAGDLGFVPVPLRGLDGRTLYERAGRCWEVTPWMPGAPDGGGPPPPERIRAAFAALGAFHQRLAHHQTVGPSPGVRSRLRELLAWQSTGFTALAAILSGREDDPYSGPARRWLVTARARAPEVLDRLNRAAAAEVPRQPCLRDVRPDHVLFLAHEVAGLVDFGAMGIDSVALDLARLVTEWSLGHRDARRAALAAYVAVRPIGPLETSLIEVFERSSAVLVGAHWVRWHFFERRVFDDPEAVARGIAKGLARLGEDGSAFGSGRIEVPG